jgi:hypothetical protein
MPTLDSLVMDVWPTAFNWHLNSWSIDGCVSRTSAQKFVVKVLVGQTVKSLLGSVCSFSSFAYSYLIQLLKYFEIVTDFLLSHKYPVSAISGYISQPPKSSAIIS